MKEFWAVFQREDATRCTLVRRAYDMNQAVHEVVHPAMTVNTGSVVTGAGTEAHRGDSVTLGSVDSSDDDDEYEEDSLYGDGYDD